MTALWEGDPLPAREEIAEEWMLYAACATTDPDAFFPEVGRPGADARAVCAACDVRAQCLVYAIETNQQYGIWGGLSRNQRSRLRKKITNPKGSAA